MNPLRPTACGKALSDNLRAILMSWLWWVVLLPAVMVLATPVILVRAVFKGTRYGEAVRAMYESGLRLWTEYGMLLTS